MASESRPDGIAGKIIILGAQKEFIKHDSRAHQLMQIGVNADNIAEKVKMLESQDYTLKGSKCPRINP